MSNYKERALKLFQEATEDKKTYNETQNDRWISECVYPGKRDGYFLEAGAADGKLASSCYILESRLGWTGICVEPNDEFFQQLVKNRPNSICENVCLSDQSGQVIFMEGYGNNANPYLSGIKSNLEKFKHNSEEIIQQGREIIKAAIALEELLKKHNAPKIIDYAAFDIEGSEFEVLKNFPFHRYQFSTLSLECDGYIWDAITDLLTANGYREVKNPFNTDKNWERYWLHESLP
ncbi:FkbM family methyltransferase [Anabaena sp. UHCC 0451]|uniref:FkbM family methyltransferase n=1 Tax=Anabaena sp. UHCC 0451 TaxID=2055235 RepID=UPI002B209593|nr:FkbM family methyltransferase [Anabaena sp. UHCC 0451]MEA5578905.1 FkbM family methyltransferase [Anabaena sp. UHCC 0451]